MKGVDLLGEDGAPYYMKSDQFVKLPYAEASAQVARLHNELILAPEHHVVGAIFVGTPNQSYILDPYLCDPNGVCLDKQLIKSDGGVCKGTPV